MTRLLGAAASGAAACALPGVGQTVPVTVVRDAEGRYVRVGVAGARTEPWAVAALTPHVAVLYDTAMARVAGADPAVRRRVAQFAAAYDSTVAPFLQALTGQAATGGLPDADGNGRLVVLVPHWTGGTDATPTAYPNGYARQDCVPGEAIALPSAYGFLDDRAVAGAVLAAVHEAAHVADQSVLRGTGALDTWWSQEGVARLAEHLWAAGLDRQPLTGNRAQAPTRTIEGRPAGDQACAEPERTTLATLLRPTPAGYRLACQFTSYVFQRGLAQGLTVPALLERWTAAATAGGRLTLAQAHNTVLRAERAPADVVGAWLLSWAADDRVAGAAPDLQDTALRLSDPRRDATIAAVAGGTYEAVLAEPDARFVDLTGAAAGTRVRYAAPDGAALPAAGAGARTALAVVRLR